MIDDHAPVRVPHTCSKIAQTLTATDSMLAGGSVGVLLGTGTGSTQQYRVDKFAAQVQ